MSYTIHEVCEKTGLSEHTLRYYEKEGLLPAIGRSAGGNRRYEEEDLERLELIICLKNTGMSLSGISHFAELASEGDSTLRERCALLEAQRDHLLSLMEQMQRHLDKVSCKLDCYSRMLADYEKQ